MVSMAYAFRSSFARINFNLLKTFSKRSIMTTSVNFEKAMEDLEKNPYFEKYAQKIATLQQTSPEEFLNRIEQKIQKEKQMKEHAKIKERQYTSVLNAKPDITSDASKDEKKYLKDFMKVDLIQDKSAEEIKEIWQKYHLSKDAIAAVITKAQFELMCERFKKYPIFLLPLPRSQGYEFIMLQFSGNCIHFTPLLCYQVHKENAPECLNIVHYTELIDDKGIVLMRGEFDRNVIDTKEAQCLANQLQLYYGQHDERRLEILQQFTNSPDEFKHMDLIKQLEMLPITEIKE